MKHWEYHVHNLNTVAGGMDKVLNQFGADGWELIAAIVHAPSLQLVFKREVATDV